MNQATLIGFGEAGQAFAVNGGWRAFDIVPEKSRSPSLAEALTGAQNILSLVTADQALIAAQHVSKSIEAGAFFFDMNSVAPGTKHKAAEVIEASGGRYVDVAIMSPVHPARLAVPLLVSGPHGQAGAAALALLDFTNVRIVGDDVGRASTIKMLRSVMYKGIEALTAECLIACEKAGVTDEVLSSFDNAKGSGDWSSGADYRLDRMMVHGLRRSAEMYECSQTLLALGVTPMLTNGTIDWQQAIGELEISSVPDGLKAKLAAILERLP
jgi:3-hydroxyisobutyrate dehydrogenase-like beta-hydroxyacid dehydrogenase